MRSHRLAYAAVLCALVAQAVGQEAPPLAELHDPEPSHPRSPLALALERIAPPKGLAQALAKSLLEHQDDLKESSAVEHRWAQNEAYLGRDELRSKLASAIRATSPEHEDPSLDGAASFQPQSSTEQSMEGGLAQVMREYYGGALGEEVVATDEPDSWEGDTEVLLDEGSPTVQELESSGREMLRMAEISDDQKDLEKADDLLAQADSLKGKQRTAERNQRAKAAEQAPDPAAYDLLVQKRSLERRVEHRLEDEHSKLLGAEAEEARKKAHTAKLRAAHEMERWVENLGGSDRSSVDRADGEAKYAVEEARKKIAAAKIASSEAKEHPLMDDTANPASGSQEAEDQHAPGVSHEVAQQQEGQADKKARKALEWALLTDDGFDKAMAAVKIANAYSKSAKAVREKKALTSREESRKARLAASTALRAAVVASTKSNLLALRRAVINYRSKERKADRIEERRKEAEEQSFSSKAEDEDLILLNQKVKADGLEKQAYELSRMALRKAARTGNSEDLKAANEVAKRVAVHAKAAKQAAHKLEAHKISMSTQAAKAANTAAADATLASKAAKQDLRNANRRVKAAQFRKEDLHLAEEESAHKKRILESELGGAMDLEKRLEAQLAHKKDLSIRVGLQQQEAANSLEQTKLLVSKMQAEQKSLAEQAKQQTGQNKLAQFQKTLTKGRDADIAELEAHASNYTKTQLNEKIRDITVDTARQVRQERKRLQASKHQAAANTTAVPGEAEELDQMIKVINERRKQRTPDPKTSKLLDATRTMVKEQSPGPSFDQFEDVDAVTKVLNQTKSVEKATQKMLANTAMSKQAALKKAETKVLKAAKVAKKRVEQARQNEDPDLSDRLEASLKLNKQAKAIVQARKAAKEKKMREKEQQKKADVKFRAEALVHAEIPEMDEERMLVRDEALQRSLKVAETQMFKQKEQAIEEQAALEHLSHRVQSLKSSTKSLEAKLQHAKNSHKELSEQFTALQAKARTQALHAEGIDGVIRVAEEEADMDKVRLISAQTAEKKALKRKEQAKRDFQDLVKAAYTTEDPVSESQ